MYNTTGATLRGDLNVLVEEAAAAESGLIAQQVLPMFSVQLKTGQYPKFTKTASALMQVGGDVRAPKTSYQSINRAWTNDTYVTLDRGLKELIDDNEARDLNRFFSAEQVAARLCLRQMMLGYEKRVSDLVMSTGSFAATNSAVAYTYANKTTVDFPTDVLAAIERVADNGGQANTIVLSSTVLNRLKITTLLQNFCRGSLPADSALNLTAQALANAFRDNGITQVLVGRARYDSAKTGQAFSAANIWPNTYVWVGDVRAGDPSAGGAGRTFVWNEGGGLFVTESYRDDDLLSNVVRVRQHSIEKIVDASAGTLINTQYT